MASIIKQGLEMPTKTCTLGARYVPHATAPVDSWRVNCQRGTGIQMIIALKMRHKKLFWTALRIVGVRFYFGANRIENLKFQV